MGLFDDTLRTLLPISIDSIAGKLLLGCGLLVLAHGITILLLTLRTRWRIARWREPTDVTVLDGDLNGFTVTTGAASQRYAWTDVSVVETATQVVFVHAPCAATVVPRGAFESPEAMHLYAHVARERSNQVDELP